MIDPHRAEFRHISTVALFVAFNVCFARPALGQEGESRIILEHADSLVGTELNGEKVKELIGHVKFRQGKTIVTCDRATQYLASNKVSMEGVVEVRDDSLRMVSNRGVYYSETKIAEAFDKVLLEDPTTTLRAGYGKYFSNEKKAYFKTNVYVEDSTSVLTSDELTYYRTEQRSVAVGHVSIVSPRNGMTITGNRFESDKQKHTSKITQGPKVIQIDTTSSGTFDTLVVTSTTMESYQDSVERLIATDNVWITRNGLAAQAGVGVFFTKLDSIVLRQSPMIWYSQRQGEDNQVSGDLVFLKLNKRKLETAYVRGRAVALSQADSGYPNRFNQMTGQEIILRFSESKMKRIDVNTTATSLYYVFDGRTGNGMNKTTGDHVTIMFIDGRIDKITAVAGVEGQYVPERLIKGRESEYNLQGFNYRQRALRKSK